MSEKKEVRKTKSLKIRGLPSDIVLLDVAEATKDSGESLRGIRMIKPKGSSAKAAILDFISLSSAEDAKKNDMISIKGVDYKLQYTRSSESSTYNYSASPDKLYVRYPPTAEEDEVIKMFGNVEITKPTTATNYFFVTCKDMNQQHSILKDLNGHRVNDGEMVVKIAIEKVKKDNASLKKKSN